MEKKGFVSLTSRLSWELFKIYGSVGYYYLFKNLQDEKYLADVIDQEIDNQHEMER